MKRLLPIVSLTVAALALAAAAAFVLRSAYGGSSVADPASARCNAPQARFGPTASHDGYRQADVHFTCAGAVIAGR